MCILGVQGSGSRIVLGAQDCSIGHTLETFFKPVLSDGASKFKLSGAGCSV